MKTAIITKEQYDALRDCEITSDFRESRKAKFLRRGRQYAIVVIAVQNGSFVECSYSCLDVIIDGKQLQYKTDVTNPKNPF